MNAQEVIRIKTEQFVIDKLKHAEAGHNWQHVRRVTDTAKHIAQKHSNADIFVVELSALLHDISDAKFNGGDENKAQNVVSEFLKEINILPLQKEKILQIIKYVSFKGGKNICPEPFIELHIVQDADRLDAIGAIGIARTFHYGGFKNRIIYNPDIPPIKNMTLDQYRNSEAPTINHFYEKLLLLKDLMNTPEGKEMAQQRHQFMELFLQQFFNEWNNEN